MHLLKRVKENIPTRVLNYTNKQSKSVSIAITYAVYASSIGKHFVKDPMYAKSHSEYSFSILRKVTDVLDLI